MPVPHPNGRLPAFPCDPSAPRSGGMDLRTYLAGQALVGLLAGKLVPTDPHPSGHPMAPSLVKPDTAAECAVLMADALVRRLALPPAEES